MSTTSWIVFIKSIPKCCLVSHRGNRWCGTPLICVHILAINTPASQINCVRKNKAFFWDCKTPFLPISKKNSYFEVKIGIIRWNEQKRLRLLNFCENHLICQGNTYQNLEKQRIFSNKSKRQTVWSKGEKGVENGQSSFFSFSETKMNEMQVLRKNMAIVASLSADFQNLERLKR